MSTPVARTAAANLSALAFVAMPLFFLLVWLQESLGEATGTTDPGQVAEIGGVYYLSNLIPVLVGGLIHQVGWLLLPNSWPPMGRRIVALLLTPIIPIAVLVAWTGPAEMLLDFAVPMILALTAYVLMLRRTPSSVQEGP